MEMEQLYQLFKQSNGVCTDTRKLQKGQLFFALKGGNFNGNKFAQQALNSGAIAAVIDEAEHQTSDKTILVDNALEALQNLATHHRKQFKIPFIAITGSNGKTTTKELLAACLQSTFKTTFTQGNLNNHIGVPLTLLSIPNDAQMAVIEMGANHLIEINQLCKIALPKFGMITNIGKAHLEGFGSIEGVQKGKGELFEFLDSSGGRCFVNMNDNRVADIAYFIQKATTYGKAKYYNNRVKLLPSSNGFLKVRWHWNDKLLKNTEIIDIQTQLTGDYNLDNVTAAITIANYFKVLPERIKTAIENYVPTNNRSQIINKGDYQLVLDAYNANPSSTKAAIENLAKKEGKKIAILGDMLEMGEYEMQEHQVIVDLLEKLKIDDAILIGKAYNQCRIPDYFKSFEDTAAAQSTFDELDKKGAIILLKGSRGVAVEKLLN